MLPLEQQLPHHDLASASESLSGYLLVKAFKMVLRTAKSP